MICTTHPTNALPAITRLFPIVFGILLSISLYQKVLAASDDVEFNECAQALDQTPGTLTADYWRKPPLGAKVAQLEDRDL